MTRRNKIVLALMLLIGIGILLFSLRDINMDVLIHDFVTINPWWFGVAVICILLYLGIEAVITKIFVGKEVKGFTFKDALRVPAVEQLFNGITPFSSGGQPAQLFVMIQSGVEGGKAGSALLMKFVVYQAMIVINFLISLLIGFHYIAEKLSFLSLFVVFGFLIHLAVIIGLLMVMYWHSFTKKLVKVLLVPVSWFMKRERFIKMEASLDERIDSFNRESVRLAHDWKLLLKVFALTFVQLLFYYLIPYFIMLSLGYTQANIVMITSLHVLIVMVISIFPIPGGAGGAEYSFSVLFQSYITNNSKLVLAMILWRILTYYFGMIAGMIAMVIQPDRVKQSDNIIDKIDD